jgi:hypothetical protein
MPAQKYLPTGRALLFAVQNSFFFKPTFFLNTYMVRDIKGVYLNIETTAAPPNNPFTVDQIDIDKTIEEWKPVAGYEGFYSISSLGRVRSEFRQVKCGNAMYTVREKILKPFLRSGYYSVVFMSGSSRQNRVIHRLVAEAFLEKIPGKPYVNHLDTCKTNNHVTNLQYVTQLENVRHSYALGRYQATYKSKSKTVMQLSMDGKDIIKIWPSTMEAHRHGFDTNGVSRVARFEQSHYKGFLWRYVDFEITHCKEGKAV